MIEASSGRSGGRLGEFGWVICDFRRIQILGTLAPMPAPKPQDARRGQLVQGLLWAGVGLAPLAVLVLLFGSSTGALRVAVVLITLTAVMVALSIALRPSVELLRADIEERVLDEVDTIRARAREDVSTAARNTHRALSERIRVLGETIDGLRDQIDEMQAATFIGDQHRLPVGPAANAGLPHHPAHSSTPGVVRRTETVQVTRRTTMVGGGDDEGQGTVYGSRPAGAVEGQWRERGPDPHAEDRWAGLRLRMTGIAVLMATARPTGTRRSGSVEREANPGAAGCSWRLPRPLRRS